MADNQRPRKATSTPKPPPAAKKTQPRKTSPPPAKKTTPRRTDTKLDPAKKVTPGRGKKPPADPTNVVPFKRGAGRGTGARSTGSKTSPKAINVAERRAHVVALRRAAVSFSAIAEEIRTAKDERGRPRYGVSEAYNAQRAHEDVLAALDRYVASNVAEYRDEALARLDFALMNVVPKLGTADWKAAVDALVKLDRRRSALLGLDADKRFQISGTGPDGSIILSVPVTDPEVSYDAALAAVNEILGPPKELPGG